VELSPSATAGIPIGTQISQAPPPAISTARMRTEVLGGVHLKRTPGAQGHWDGALRRGRRDRLFAGGAMGFVSKTRKRFELARALAAWGGRCRWTLTLGAMA
jgi:hypothetical protein